MPDRSIRNVPVSTRRGRENADPEFVRGPRNSGYRMPPRPPARRPRRWPLVLGAVVLFGGIGAVMAFLFQSATVTVVPRTANVTPANSFTATFDTGDAAEGLHFKQISASASTTRTVKASGTKNVSATAQGTATLFNKFSTSPQTLVTNTRFQTTDGKIYRIHQTVVVPGGKKAADGTLAAGSVEAMLYADKPGPDYNTGALQLSIPGLKGSPRYNSLYATVQSISGGSSGTTAAVSSADQTAATKDMQSELQTKLTQQLSAQVPSGYVLVPKAVAISYSDVSAHTSGSNSAVLSLSATASAAVVKMSDLAAAAATGVAGYNGESVAFADPAQIPVALSPDSSFAANSTSLDLGFSGPVNLVWQVDANAIAKALAGKSKKEFQTIMQNFKPAVASASAAMHPFWLSAFPAEGKIRVQIKPE